MSAFKFALGQQVQITCSAESGKVTGRAEYAGKGNQYFLLYKGADGRAVHDWWDESALEADEQCIQRHDRETAPLVSPHRSFFAPKCIDCRYFKAADGSLKERFDRCMHPSNGVDLVRGVAVLRVCDLLRSSRNQANECGESGQWFESIDCARVSIDSAKS